MKTMEQILNEIQNAMTLNKNNVAKCNVALSDAKGFIMHEEKELQNRLDEEYKRGMNDAWEIAKELCDVDYDELCAIFNYEEVEQIIKCFTPLEVKEKIAIYRTEKESNKVCVGDVVKDMNDDTMATILDYDHDTNLAGEGYWMVFTENGCVESWCENEFVKTGESVDVCGVLIK